MMTTAVMMMPGETRLLELLDGRQLSARRRVLKGCRELIQLGGLRGISIVGRVLSRLLEPGRDLRQHLAESRRVLLLELGKLIEQGRSRRNAGSVTGLRGGDRICHGRRRQG